MQYPLSAAKEAAAPEAPRRTKTTRAAGAKGDLGTMIGEIILETSLVAVMAVLVATGFALEAVKYGRSAGGKTVRGSRKFSLLCRG